MGSVSGSCSGLAATATTVVGANPPPFSLAAYRCFSCWREQEQVVTSSGIEHKIKSVDNPDLRVEHAEEYVTKNSQASLLDYALGI